MRDFPKLARVPFAVRALGIAAFTFLIYAPALRGDFLWDDDLYLTQNPTIAAPDGLTKIWTHPSTASPSPYPLVFTTFWFEYRLWGFHPLGYHVVNVLFHALNAILLGVALERLEVAGAWLAAFLFAIHPIHAESTAWINERKDVMSGFFYLLALLGWLRFERTSKWRDYSATAALFFLAMLSKTVTCTFPVALMLTEWRRDTGQWKKTIKLLTPFFAAALVWGAVTAWWERSELGAVGEQFNFSILQRCLIAGRAPWFYTAKLLWPSPLVTIYPRWELGFSRLTLLFPAATAAVLSALWHLRRRIAGTATALAFFLITLFPALGFFNFTTMMYSFAADHYQYLAGIGWIALISAMAARVTAKLNLSGRIWSPILLAPLILGLGVASLAQSAKYRNTGILFGDNLAKNPNAWVVQNNVAASLAAEGKLDEAVAHYRRAIELNTTEPDLHNNLGDVLARQENWEAAVVAYRECVRLQPEYAVARNNLGRALSRLGEFDQAVENFRIALKLDPQLPEAKGNLEETLRLKSGRNKMRIRGHGGIKGDESDRD